MSGKIRFALSAVLLLLVAVLWLVEAGHEARFAVQGPKLSEGLLDRYERERESPLSAPVRAELSLRVPSGTTERTRSALRASFEAWRLRSEGRRPAQGKAGTSLVLDLAWSGEDALTLRVDGVDAGSAQLASFASLLPPFLTILAAIALGKTIPALLLGVLLACFWMYGLLGGLQAFAVDYIYGRVLTSEFRLEILGFIVFLVITIGVLTRAGGIDGLVEVLKRLARSARSSQLVTWLMGFVIFFDDYANTLVVGSTMRPLTDRMRVSREKLAYIVDSTAAPIAGISLLSTWVAYEISTFSAQLPEVGMREAQGFQVFLDTLPFRFYCIFTLFLVGASILLRRDFGPMLAAERRARRTGQVLREGAVPMLREDGEAACAKDGAPARWVNGALPIAVLVGVTMYFLWQTGAGDRGFAFDLRLWRDVLFDAKSAKAILLGSMASAAVACVLALAQRILSPVEILKTSWQAVRGLGFAMIILVLAWCIGYACQDMGTAYYLVALTQGGLPPLLLPVILFALSCLVAFATGSSWSTMAILLPIVVILAHSLGEGREVGSYLLMVLSIGAVLEGSIFGDHCSPISDTTVLSSVAAASDHLDHVQTQIPYAMLTMIVSILIGYLPAAFFSPKIWPLSLALGMALIVVFLLLVGRNPDAAPDDDPAN